MPTPEVCRFGMNRTGRRRDLARTMTTTPMPETDWLTGLSSRAAFARQVNQADRDRDPFTIAVIGILDFAEVNRQMGHEAGDDLLRLVGRALAAQTSVNTTAARLDGTRFGLLGLQTTEAEMTQWLRPIVSATKSAVADWIFDQIDFGGDCPVEPEVLVGTATGFSSQVWVDAANAMEVATTDPDGRAVVHHDPGDPQFIDMNRRREQVRLLTNALNHGQLTTATCRVGLVCGDDPDWRWLRLEIGPVGPCGQASREPAIDPSALPDGLGRRLERWLVERAGTFIAEAAGQIRLTVPVVREVATGRAFAQRLFPTLEKNRIPPSRMLFEVTEGAMVQSGTRGWEFARQVRKIGSGIVLSDCEGGLRTLRIIDSLSIDYLKPHPRLVERGTNGDQASRRILTVMAKNATMVECELIAPRSTVPAPILADLGFVYLERDRTDVGNDHHNPLSGNP